MSVETKIAKAIYKRHPIYFTYNNLPRLVEPHHFGILKGKKQLHAFQYQGQSVNGPLPQWRNFKLRLIKDLSINENQFFNVRHSYNPNNCKFSRIDRSVWDLQ
ncbi:hypothetical protein [Legionella gresilensis]|uniref:hypothetical protein n=1 Tax=Legionella gresilensis TaxID=91823 RepID=UPI001040E65D|nr:hypothetical protein [Legionella gresilensis]